MCSIIATNRQNDLDLVFLENRDRPRELFVGNSIRKIGGVVGIYDFRARGMACGYSIKSGTAGGVANILGYTGKQSRGVLLLKALQEGSSASGVARIIEKEISSGDYGSATYVLCDEKSIIRIESFGTKMHESKSKATSFIVATNHFNHLKYGKQPVNSVRREKFLRDQGNNITEAGVLELASRHRNPAICRHGRTLASFAVFKERRRRARVLYSIGEPCRGYKEFHL